MDLPLSQKMFVDVTTLNAQLLQCKTAFQLLPLDAAMRIRPCNSVSHRRQKNAGWLPEYELKTIQCSVDVCGEFGVGQRKKLRDLPILPCNRSVINKKAKGHKRLEVHSARGISRHSDEPNVVTMSHAPRLLKQ